MWSDVRSEIRELIRNRYNERCAYCGIQETDAGGRLTIDHFQPVSQGGKEELENLVYACHLCNTFKSDYWEMDEEASLLHPLHDNLSEHLIESVTHHLIPLSGRGRVYIQVLHLNRPELVEQRRLRYRQQMTDRVLQELMERFIQLEAEIKNLQEQLKP
ncbi:MAG: hypothetical protein OHK0029_22140 [Armatimonadaceae bacterium]